MNVRTVYLLMAIVGAVIPLVFFASFGAEEGISLTGFISAAFVNGAAGGLTADLLISSCVFWIYMWTKRDSGPVA